MHQVTKRRQAASGCIREEKKVYYKRREWTMRVIASPRAEKRKGYIREENRIEKRVYKRREEKRVYTRT